MSLLPTRWFILVCLQVPGAEMLPSLGIVFLPIHILIIAGFTKRIMKMRIISLGMKKS